MTNLKALMERREELRQNMETLVSTADTECRAMTEEEAAQFDTAENELRAIDATIEREERTRGRRMPRNVLPQRRAPLSIMCSAAHPNCVPVNRI